VVPLTNLSDLLLFILNQQLLSDPNITMKVAHVGFSDSLSRLHKNMHHFTTRMKFVSDEPASIVHFSKNSIHSIKNV
jgi:hypothetical protein